MVWGGWLHAQLAAEYDEVTQAGKTSAAPAGEGDEIALEDGEGEGEEGLPPSKELHLSAEAELCVWAATANCQLTATANSGLAGAASHCQWLSPQTRTEWMGSDSYQHPQLAQGF